MELRAYGKGSINTNRKTKSSRNTNRKFPIFQVGTKPTDTITGSQNLVCLRRSKLSKTISTALLYSECTKSICFCEDTGDITAFRKVTKLFEMHLLPEATLRMKSVLKMKYKLLEQLESIGRVLLVNKILRHSRKLEHQQSVFHRNESVSHAMLRLKIYIRSSSLPALKRRSPHGVESPIALEASASF